MMNIRFVTLVPENPERLTSDQGTMLDLCLSVEGTESCGSIDTRRVVPHRLSSRKEPPAPTHQPSRATFCIRRTQDSINKRIAPGAQHRARGHMDAQGAWGGSLPPFGAFMNRPRSKISGGTLLEQMRRATGSADHPVEVNNSVRR